MDKPTYEVPNVISMTLEDAKEILSHFKVETVGDGNIIYEQSPSSKEKLEEGSVIRVYLK